jgi:Carbohydrate binding domain
MRRVCLLLMRFITALAAVILATVAAIAAPAPPPTPAPKPAATPTPLPTPTPTLIPTPTPVPQVLFPFALPPLESAAADKPVAPDVSWLNPTPAGASGFVAVRGEHFVDGQGKPLRFWGVNLNFSGLFPSKEDAPKIASRIARFGFNAARIHHFEGYPAPNGLWKSIGYGSSRVKMPRGIDPAQLDRLDFFLSELIKNGIYINLNLHTGRKVNQAEGVPFAADLPEKDKGVDYFDERLIALQKEFSRTLLNHVNPYTGRAYKDEPGVCAVEVSNENSLLGMWLSGTLKMPPQYSEALQKRWNEWLARKYTEASLRAAWTEIDAPLHLGELLAQPLPYDIINPNAPDSRIPVALNSLSRYKLATVTGAVGNLVVDAAGGPLSPDGLPDPGLSINMQRTGTVSWAFQVNRDGLDLQEGQPYTLTFRARADTPRQISVNLWQDQEPNRFEGFTGYANLTANWEKYTFVFRPSNPDPQHSRLSWNLGNQTGTVQLADMELQAGGRITAPETWTLARGLPLIEFKTTPILAARRDFAEFLGEIEKQYAADMRAFLKTEIGLKVPIWQSQAQFGGWGGIAREMESDAIDLHAYWKHPDLGGNGWTTTAWKIGNQSMTAAAMIDPLSAFALFRVAGKPFVMSEWNSGQPNDFSAETLLMAAAYAAWQDWAAVYLFDYHSNGSYNRDRFENFFSIDTHPVKMATAPAAALLYRRPPPGASAVGASTAGASAADASAASLEAAPGDLKAADTAVTLTMPRAMLWNEVAGFADGPTATPIIKTWRDAGAPRAAPLEGKAYVRFNSGVFPTASRATLRAPQVLLSDTRQIVWNRGTNTFCVNTPKTKVVIGFLGGRSTMADEFQIAMPPSQSNFAAFALSSLDDGAIAQSKRLLLVAAGKAENQAMGWNADRSSVGNNWGNGPTRVEGIVANIRVLTNYKNARVWALDVSGQQRSEVPSALRNGVLRFSIGPQWKTLWYEIVSR